MKPNQHRLQPLTQWICDHCGDVISSASEGWLEWYQERSPNGTWSKNKGFRIVHRDPPCIYNERKHMSLENFVEANGLNYLLSKLGLDAIDDVSSYIEIMCRLQIPYYEEARLYHEDAVQDGYFDGENELTRGLQETSVDLLNYYVR